MGFEECMRKIAWLSTATYVDGQRIEVHPLGVEVGATEGEVEREGKNNEINSCKEKYYITELRGHVI